MCWVDMCWVWMPPQSVAVAVPASSSSWTLAIITKTNLVLAIGVGQLNLLGLPLMIIICRAIIDGVGTVSCKVNIAVLADDVVCNRDRVAGHPTRVILGQIEGLLGGDDVDMIG